MVLLGCAATDGTPATDDTPATDTPEPVDTTPAEVCDDGADNDGDDAVDCFDNDCATACDESLACDDGLDNDHDDRIDCRDADCDAICDESLACDDLVDNDLDGLVDLYDDDCAALRPGAESDCANLADDDFDGRADCGDADCLIPCDESLACGDGVDNDLDGVVDLYDEDCAAYRPAAEVDCTNLSDDDFDGSADCRDADCLPTPACQAPHATEYICGDGLDDDGDGWQDCADRDCGTHCIEFACDDGLDEDLDGAIDCADGDCVASCTERGHCRDGIDNNRDGLVDCEDAQCAYDAACTEGDCGDGIDRDQDGAIDCDDDECWGAAACRPVITRTRGTALRDLDQRQSASSCGAGPVHPGFYYPAGHISWTLANVGGTAVFPAGTACTFEIDEVHFGTILQSEDSNRGVLATRTGLRVQPGCAGILETGHFPPYVFSDGADLMGVWGTWFARPRDSSLAYHLVSEQRLNLQTSHVMPPAGGGCAFGMMHTASSATYVIAAP